MTDFDLQFGANLSIGNITVRHPYVRDIKEYGEENYLNAISLFVMKPSDMMVQLYDMGIDYTQTTPYEIFIMLCGEMISADEKGVDSEVRKRLEWLTGIPDFFLCLKGENDICLHSESANATIDLAVYLEIRRFIMRINFRSEKERFNPGNETTKKALIEEERRRQKREARKRNKPSFLSDHISSLVWGNNSGYKYNDVLDMPIFQFYDGLYRLNKIKNYDFNMMGFFTGNISEKSFKSIEEKIDWMGPIVE